MPNSTKRTVAGHAFQGLADWVEVFRAGTHTDSQGRSCTFTEADLDQMAANVVALGAPPAVLGHPKHDHPAYAWAREARRDGESLFVKFADVNPAFEAGVASGAYRNRSVAVVKDKQHGWRVRHVGWLGAAPPAIDGLQPMNYSAGDADCHEFSLDEDLATAYALDGIAQLLRGLREQLIADKGLDAANNALPDWRITSVASTAEQLRQAAMEEAPEPGEDTPARLYSRTPRNPRTPTGSTMPATFTEEQLEAARREAATNAAAEAVAEAERRFAAQGAELSELRAARQRDRISHQLQAWQREGRLTPAEAPGMAEFMAALEGAGSTTFEFTAPGATTPAKKTPTEWFAEFMASRKPVVQLGAGGGANPGSEGATVDTQDAQALAAAAREFMAAEAAAGRTVSAAQAVHHITTTRAAKA